MPSYLLETGWGVLFTFMVAGAFLALAVRPTLVLPVLQLGVAAASLAVVGVGAGEWLLIPVAALLAGGAWGVWALVHAEGPPVAWGRVGLDPVVGTLGVVATPPAVAFASAMVVAHREHRPPPDNVTWGINHWATQAACPSSSSS